MRILALLLLPVSIAVHAETLLARVIGIADGDSLYVLDSEKHEHEIRLLGIDAPEHAQAFGDAAKQSLKQLLHGQTVLIEWNKRDRYGRLLGKINIGGTDAGLHQIMYGMAWWNQKFAHDQAPEDAIFYREAEFVARKKRLGLWSQKNPVPPWQWRYANPRQTDTVSP